MGLALKAVKLKKCKVCLGEFTPRATTQKVCSPSCAIKLVEANKRDKLKKAASDDIKRVKQKLKQLSMKDRPKALRAAQAAFNAFIRERDKDLPCISCQRHHKGQYHAGHYLSRGAHPELAFSELNNNKQCSKCNNYLSGNLLNYRVNLIKKIGLDKVEWLEGPHDNVKMSALELWELQKRYKKKLKDLINESS